ncbi:AAEL014439-PA [Aedes aegypti]|uniref:AAEL014439-PA n=1 Tax=Aedes aegypti TaxID=7159 RepID=Q16GB3_AEDAE|nr:AAEL014439-PA [Aedes aegypti]
MGQHNADELQAPSWLNSQFLLEVIRKAQNDPSLTLCHGCNLRPGTNAGDHYASIMFRTTVHYRSARYHKEQAISLIMKLTTQAEGFKKELLDGNGLFETETKMYSEVLPAMSKALAEVGEHLEVPRLIYASSKPHTIIILEDVSLKGWLTGRELITSYEEALPTIRNVAKFHAASYFLNQSTMDLSKNRIEMFMKADGGAFAVFYKGFDAFCDAVQTWPGCEKFAAKFKNLKGATQKKIQQVYTANAKDVGYNVLNHADLHWKNLLHKKSVNGRIKDSMLIDYQCCHWGSPAIDLISLVNMVVNHDIKQNCRQEIIYEYYQHFVQILDKLGFLGSVPTLTDLHMEMLRKGFLEVFHVVVFEQFKHVQLTETTFDDLNAGRGENPGFGKEPYMDVVRKEMPTLMYKGLLD